MYKASIAAIIENKRILIVTENGEIWKLPGGRQEDGEDPLACLEREVREELHDISLTDVVFLETIPSLTTEGEALELRVYRAGIDGPLNLPTDSNHSMEIRAAEWYPGSNGLYTFNPSTKDILEKLVRNGMVLSE